MGRDFPGRFGEATELFSSTLSGSNYTGVEVEPATDTSELFAGGKQVVKKSAEIWAGFRVVVPHPRTDPTDPSDDLDCADQVRASRAIAEELSLMNEILRTNLGAMVIAQVEISAWLTQLYGLIADRTPHRKWLQAAVMDHQQQIRDGFDAVCQRIAQAVDASKAVRCAELQLPELGPTPKELDFPSANDISHLIWKAKKKETTIP